MSRQAWPPARALLCRAGGGAGLGHESAKEAASPLFAEGSDYLECLRFLLAHHSGGGAAPCSGQGEDAFFAAGFEVRRADLRGT